MSSDLRDRLTAVALCVLGVVLAGGLRPAPAEPTPWWPYAAGAGGLVLGGVDERVAR